MSTYRARAIGPAGWGDYAVDWSSGAPVFEPCDGQADLRLVPGFVDLHIHGAFGIDFMADWTSRLVEWCEKLGDCGYEAFLPTTVSASASDVLNAIGRIPDHPMICGFHLEGPFISPKYPGAQPPEAIAAIPEGPSEWDAVLDHPKLRYVTLAPELPGAGKLIERLVGRGVAVSMGHSDATFSQAQSGFGSGVRHATHTFNAMRGFHHREAGAAGFCLQEDGLRTELIYDRLHVAREAAAVLLKSKPSEGVIAVSDGTMASGIGDGESLTMWNHAVETRIGGVFLKGSQTLAGSAITLLDAFRNLAEDFGEEIAVRCCCVNPRLALPELASARVYLEFDRKWELVGKRTVAQP